MSTGETEVKIEVIHEALEIERRTVETGKVTVEKTVESETVRVPLTDRQTVYRERRVPVNRVIDEMPEIREVDGTLIVPVVREEQIITTRLVLVEEIHLIREDQRTDREEEIVLRRDRITINRT